MRRQILHVDMDAFYVAVEQLENPALLGRPVIVGADPGGRGVVMAASYEARRFGVHSAQPIRLARRLCPHAVFLRGHHAKYAEYSRRLDELFAEFTPLVEMVSIDEAYLDLTGCERLHGPAFRAADCLIRAIKNRIGLNASVGLATSHLVAKIASDQAKPRGLLYVLPGYEAEFLAPLPVGRMPGIGKVTEPQLLSLGLVTIGDLARFGRDRLRARFGKLGEWFYAKSLGQEGETDPREDGPKSISHETTFEEDTNNVEELQRTLSWLSQRVGRRLREHRLFARTVGLKIRFAPFRTITRDATLDEPTHLDWVIFQNVLQLFENVFDPGLRVRLLGVRVSNLEAGVFQRRLLDAAQTDKLSRLAQAADQIRSRFGFEAVQWARSLERGGRAVREGVTGQARLRPGAGRT